MNYDSINDSRESFSGTDLEYLSFMNEFIDKLLPRHTITLTTIRGAVGKQVSDAIFDYVKQNDPYGYQALIPGVESDSPQVLNMIPVLEQFVPSGYIVALKELIYSHERRSNLPYDLTQDDLDQARKYKKYHELDDALHTENNRRVALLSTLYNDPSGVLPNDISGL